MAGLDTNVLVRWLINDDPAQSLRVQQVIQQARHRQQPLVVPVTVVLELEWVLRSRYGIGKPEIIGTMNALLETHDLLFQFEPAVERAVHLFRRSAADFADCLHASLCAVDGGAPLLTFDRRAGSLPGVELLNA